MNFIKIKEPLLGQLLKAKPTKQSFSAFVKTILKKEIRRIQNEKAGLEYVNYLKKDKKEMCELEEWGNSSFGSVPTKRKKK